MVEAFYITNKITVVQILSVATPCIMLTDERTSFLVLHEYDKLR